MVKEFLAKWIFGVFSDCLYVCEMCYAEKVLGKPFETIASDKDLSEKCMGLFAALETARIKRGTCQKHFGVVLSALGNTMAIQDMMGKDDNPNKSLLN